MNYSKYVGIPYVFNGRTMKGADCIGLLCLFYADQGWPETFSDGEEITPDWFEKEPYRFAKYLIKNFDRVTDINELPEGSVLLFEINGESHTAIYCGFGKFLSTFPPIGLFNGNVSFMDRLKYYPNIKVVGMFKRRS